MKQLTLGEAKEKWPTWLEQAAQGEDVESSGDGVTYAVSVAIRSAPTATGRTPGLGKGSLLHMSEDFDEELPDAFWLGTE